MTSGARVIVGVGIVGFSIANQTAEPDADVRVDLFSAEPNPFDVAVQSALA